jgi:flotillin
MGVKRRAASSIFNEQQMKQMEEIAEDEEYLSQEEPVITQNEGDFLGGAGGGEQIQQKTDMVPPMEKLKKKVQRRPKAPVINMVKSSEEMQLEKDPIHIRITGRWFWQRVIVPPNAYVVHTRINRKKPVTMGLGKSFKYNPNTDAYLVIPAAMQTIGVVANCISKEKQGINILAYVQWQIDDFSVAYKKLDLSDQRDPLGIVNAQLREQAEAAIKDKIATMSVEEVLTDKAPIIEELTNRLKAVTEGRKNSGGDAAIEEGLGIKIVTVQIREALVCSSTLWENLQSPFRHEQQKKERISYLEMVNEINDKEMETRRLKEATNTEVMVEIERIKQQKQTEALEIKIKEEAVRFEQEQKNNLKKIAMAEQKAKAEKESSERIKIHENQLQLQTELEFLRHQDKKAEEEESLRLKEEQRLLTLEAEKQIHELKEAVRAEQVRIQTEEQKMEQDTVLKKKQADYHLLVQANQDKLKEVSLQARLEREQAEHKIKLSIEEEQNTLRMARLKKETEIEEMRQKIKNILNDNMLFSALIDKLPEIAAHMPEVKELKILNTGGGDATFDSLAAFLTKIFALAENLGIPLPVPGKKPDGKKDQPLK